MLLLSEATLFFWNIPRSDDSKTKNELVSRITKWRGSVATGPIKRHIRNSSGSSTLANQFAVVKAGKTTVSDDILPKTQGVPVEEPVGDKVDDSQEWAALGQGAEKPDQAFLAITTTSLVETAEEAQVNTSRPLKRKYLEPEDDVILSEVEDPVFREGCDILMDVDVGGVIEDDGDEEMEEAGGHGGCPSEADNTSVAGEQHANKAKTEADDPRDATTSSTDLPADWFKQDKWRCKVLPTLCLWAGAQPNMWDMPKEKITGVLGRIIPVVFPELSETARKLTAQHEMVSAAYQCLYVWRHSIGSAALSLCASFFGDLTQEKIVEETGVFLTRHSYLYQDIDCDDPSKAFKSEFIIRLLAHVYLPSIKGFVHVDKLDTSALSHCGIQGILGICGAALQRALHLFNKGAVLQDSQGKGTICTPATLKKASSRVTTTRVAFSERNWGTATKGLSGAAKRRTPDELDSILELVRAAAGESAVVLDGTSEEAEDGYAVI